MGALARRARLRRGWTTRELATQAGLSPGLVGQIETGRRSPDPTQAMKLALALDLDLDQAIRLSVRERLPGELKGLIDDRGEVTTFAAARRHLEKLFDYDIGVATLEVTGEASGVARFRRELRDCRPLPGREISCMVFSQELVEGRQAARPASPHTLVSSGVKHELRSRTTGGRMFHELHFPRLWALEDSSEAVSLVVEGELPSRFHTEPPAQPDERRFSGWVQFHVGHPTRRLELAMTFGVGQPETWLEPWSWLGNASLPDVTRNLGAGESCLRMALAPGRQSARLVVEEPIVGFCFALAWRMPAG